jgi:DNA-binding MarR family transcriptional regulator
MRARQISICGLGNHQISQFIDVSVAKFNQSLGKLRATGLVQVSPNPADNRRKLYDLPEPVRRELDQLHDKVAIWLTLQKTSSEADADPGQNKPSQDQC